MQASSTPLGAQVSIEPRPLRHPAAPGHEEQAWEVRLGAQAAGLAVRYENHCMDSNPLAAWRALAAGSPSSRLPLDGRIRGELTARGGNLVLAFEHESNGYGDATFYLEISGEAILPQLATVVEDAVERGVFDEELAAATQPA